VSCNCWLRAMNAFCRWLHEQGEIPALVKLSPQRLEKRIIDTHGEAALRAILTYRPKTFPHRARPCARLNDPRCRLPHRGNADHPRNVGLTRTRTSRRSA
jgi:hypothetical protein